ncbi:MAG: cation:proton antiporter [Ignavibacteriales bacterium]|nr:MAG: cation:proton antiporter [Ignavibacteriales bacterium]
MHEYGIIKDIVIILLVSIPIIFLFKKLSIPGIVGFLIAGVIIGPYGFRLISEVEQINIMAEVGVILLLFTIGLEVSFGKLIKMRRMLLLAGGLQLIITITISALLLYVIGLPLPNSIFGGMIVSLSSTAIVLKLLTDRGELEAPHGRLALSILIFQDLAVVPMFILLPILGGKLNTSFIEIVLQLVYAFTAVAVILILAKFLMPKILFHLARLRIREAFTIGTILLLLGTAYLTYSFGLSFALGAFIAGIILSESEFSPQVVADIVPFKDVFNSIFFVSVGLLLNINFVILNPLTFSVTVIGVIILKAAIIIIIVKSIKYPLRVGVLTAISLAQIGEFSFVIAQAGMKYDLLTGDLFNAFIAASIFTMMLTPLLITLAPGLALKSSSLEPVKKGKTDDTLKDHVIIVGFGLNGKNLARVLKEAGIKYVVVELNPETVKKEKAGGENIIYGDINKEEILHHAHIREAKIIVYAISDPVSSRRGLQAAKKINSSIYAIVRTRYTNEIEELMNLGADEVIPEEFETSLQIFSKVLERYHIPLNVIMKQVAILRGESYMLLRKEEAGIGSFVHLGEILAAGLTETFYVDEKNPHLGKALTEINLRAQTDATIIAIVRGSKTISSPSGKETLQSADTLVITGSHQAVDKAIELLSLGNS